MHGAPPSVPSAAGEAVPAQPLGRVAEAAPQPGAPERAPVAPATQGVIMMSDPPAHQVLAGGNEAVALGMPPDAQHEALDVDDDEAPQLAAAPSAANDDLWVVQLAHSFQHFRPDVAAVAALAVAARSGRSPCPARVCARDPSHTLSPSQTASYSAYVSDTELPALPTLKELRRDAMSAAQAGNRDPELDTLLAAAERDVRPRSDVAHELCKVLPHLKPCPRSTVDLAPRLQGPAPGKLSTLDPAGFLDAHAAHCSRCAGDAPCAIPPLAEWLGAVTLPFKAEPLPEQLRMTVEAEAYDETLADRVWALLDEGSLEQSEDVVHVSPLFLTWKTSVALSVDELAKVMAEGSAGALSLAEQRAQLFIAAYKEALAQPSSGGARDAPSARDVRAAWDAGQRAWGGTQKPRVVCDLSLLTPLMHSCSLRYPALSEFMAGLRPGYFIVKLDAKSGFHQLPLNHAARRYFGARVRLRPGEPPTTVRYTREAMGSHAAPLTFCALTAEILRIVKAKTGVDCCGAYCDDFYFGCPTEAAAQAVLETLKSVLGACGVVYSPSKTSVRPVQSDVILGIMLDTVAMTATLPADKQVLTLALAVVLRHCAAEGVPVPETALGELGGRLTWWGSVDDELPAGTRELRGFSKHANNHWTQWRRGTHAWGATRPRQLAELDWLLDRARRGELLGCSLLRNGTFSLQRAVCFAVDASGADNAVGIVSELGAVRVRLPDCERLAVPVLELLGPVLIYALYGEHLEGLTVRVASDASGACWWVAKGRAGRDDANDLLRILRAAARARQSLPYQRWLTRGWNFLGDRSAARSPVALARAREVPVGDFVAEITLHGLPSQFLRDLAGPRFIFSTAAWEAHNARA